MTEEHVYISYAKSQFDLAVSVKNALENEGVRIWQNDEDLSILENRRLGIANSAAFVAILSDDYHRSTFCKKEYALAHGRDRPIVLVATGDQTGTSDTVSYPVINGEDAVDDIFKVDPIVQLCMGRPPLPSGHQQAAAPPIEALAPPPTHHAETQSALTDVFISYATADKADVDDICRHLDRANLSYWDYHRSKRRYDVPLYEEMQQKLNSCRSFLCVHSDSYERSEHAQNEYAFAQGSRMALLHIRFREKRETLLGARHTYINCIGENRVSGLFELSDAIRDVIRQTSQQ